MSHLFTLYHYIFSGLDLLFPPVCAGCQRTGVRWCSVCSKNSKYISDKICKICGIPERDNSVCKFCVENPPSFSVARAWGFHEGSLREVVHQLKYRRNLALGEAVSKELATMMLNQNWKIDFVLPVPLAKKRSLVRGYNQAGLLAYPLAWNLGLKYSAKILYRARETKTQIGLNREERRENVRNAFALKSNIIKEKTILLVDDVFTTGATLNSASDALLSAGAKKVYALTISRAPGFLKN